MESELSRFQKELDNTQSENTSLKESAARIQVAFTRNEIELDKVKKELDAALESIEKFNKGKGKLDEVISTGKSDTSGLGYKSSKPVPNCPIFVKEGESTSKTSEKLSRKPRRRKYACHHCFTHGHIRPFCWKLLQRTVSTKVLPKTEVNILKTNSVSQKRNLHWVPKTELKCNVVYASIKSKTLGSWYFDGGGSRHMTGTKSFFVDYQPMYGGFVTFGGGAKGKVIGKGTLKDYPS